MAPYTKEMLKRFDQLTLMISSTSQIRRIEGRLELKAFMEKHGKDVCDAMFAKLTKRGKTVRGNVGES